MLGTGGDADGDAGPIFHRHVQDTTIILEEGNLLHPRCPQCDILVPWWALNRKHLTTAQCDQGVKRKRRRMAKEELRESADRDFQDYSRSLEMVTSFKYLGRVLKAEEDNWPEVVGNLRKACKS